MGWTRGGWRHPGTISITGGLGLDPEKHTESDPPQAAPLARGSSKDGLEVGRSNCLPRKAPHPPATEPWVCFMALCVEQEEIILCRPWPPGSRFPSALDQELLGKGEEEKGDKMWHALNFPKARASYSQEQNRELGQASLCCRGMWLLSAGSSSSLRL